MHTNVVMLLTQPLMIVGKNVTWCVFLCACAILSTALRLYRGFIHRADANPTTAAYHRGVKRIVDVDVASIPVTSVHTQFRHSTGTSHALWRE